jgi:hypothetical protein
MSTAPINAYMSFKRVTRVPNTAQHLAKGSSAAGLPWEALVDPDVYSALLLRYTAPEGTQVALRVSFARLVDSLIGADCAEDDAWEPVRQDSSNGMWGNTTISATREEYKGMVHIGYHRRDRAPIRDWRVGQRLKNELAGPEFEGFELYPAESRVVDTANEYHMYCFPFSLPFGFDQGERATQAQLDSTYAGPGDGPMQRDDPGADTSSFKPEDIKIEAVRFPPHELADQGEYLINLLSEFLDQLPAFHPERPGLVRAREVLRHA